MVKEKSTIIYLRLRAVLILSVLIFISSCGFKISSKGDHNGTFISGIVSPFLGQIAERRGPALLLSEATAAACADPVFARLYKIETNGTINESAALTEQELGPDARYNFNLKALGITKKNSTVEYIVKAEGCNGDVYKRPVTDFNSKQDINAKTTVVSEVINANNLVANQLNKVQRTKVESLINSLDGTTTSTALNSLINKAESANNFSQIFGASPTVLQDSRPEVTLEFPSTAINELAVSVFKVNAFHVDPNYAFAYKWKLDGAIVGSSNTFNYIPTANESGTHQLIFYIGKDDGNGNIDTSKPYYSNTFTVVVNNNIPATAPALNLNLATPSPRNINNVQVDLNTGVSLANCASFSKLAITDSNSVPGIVQFNISCTNSGTQTETVQFASGDGSKTLYLWAMDNEGNISSPKTINLVLDTQPPTVSLTSPSSLLKGGAALALPLSASDAGVGLNTLDLYFSTDGGTSYSLLSHVPLNSTDYNWSVPAINTSTGKLKLVATDFTLSSTTVYSTQFEIDSLAPIAPALTRTSSSSSNSRVVTISATCSADYSKILYSETSTTPALADSAWENCTSTKNFTVSTGDGVKTIYAFTKDLAGNISTSSNVTMTLDTTAPAAPVATLASPAISSSSTVSFTVTDCLDRPFVIVTESMIAPAANDANWQACTTSAGGISQVLTGPVLQGMHSLYLYAKDSVGNISSATTASVVYDTTNPTLALSTTLASLYKGGDSVAIDFSGSDTNGLSSLKLYLTTDGTNYSLVSSLATNATTYTWTIPASNTTTAKLKLEAIDNSTTANQTVVYSGTFAIDSTAPAAPVIARTSAQYSPSNAVTISATCLGDYDKIIYSESSSTPSLNDSAWEACAASKTFNTSASDGIKTIYAFVRDTAGNISSSSNVTMTLDSTAPVLNLTSFNSSGFYQGSTSVAITWSATDANFSGTPVSLSYTTDDVTYTAIASNIANSGSYSWTLPAINSSDVRLKIAVLDLAGNSSMIVSSPFTIDSAAPAVDSLNINSGALSTTNNNIQVALSAHDNLTKIQYFCLKYDDSVKPTSSASCWKDVTAPTPGIAAAKTISFSGFYFQIGFTKGVRTIYAWVKDEAGLVSNNSAVINTDTYSINFDPGTPPTLSSVEVANTNTPPNPITANELIAATGTDLYVKWNASDLEGLDANPITIQYTTDDVNFSSFPGGVDLLNNGNGTCTVDPGFTGCAKLTSPSSTYFKVRVIAKDTLGTTVFLNSVPLNELKLKILAGNTDDGLNGSATSAVFYTYGSSKDVSSVTKNRLVVSDDGKFFYIDKVRGLLWIDPSNGVLKKFINVTGTSSGDNGPVSSATLKEASAIALDYHNNLLIWDFDRIRKVDLSTMTITALLGGGANSDPATTVDANAILLPSFHKRWGSFIPLPNGNIIFDAPSISLHHRKYRSSDGKVELMDLQGTGFTNYPTDSWAASPKADIGLVFNSTTSDVSFMAKGFYKAVVGDQNSQHSRIDYNAGNETTPYPGISPYNLPFTNSSFVTGMDGKLYHVDRFRNSLYRYDHVSNTNTRILGTGASSSVPCNDNTIATSCGIDLDSVFITKTGRIYFITNGILRSIDDSNKVITIFGQFPSFGNGLLATTARFGVIQDIKMGKYTAANDTIVVEDIFSSEYREFTVGSTLTKVADVAYSSTGPFRFETDPQTGDIFSPTGLILKRFVRNTSTWSNIVGNGGTYYYDPLADGKTGASIGLSSGYQGQLLGYINNKIYYQKFTYSGGSLVGCYVKGYDTSDSYRQSHFMGTGTCSAGVANGAALATSPVSMYNLTNLEYFQDPVDSTDKFFFGEVGGAQIYTAASGGTINAYTALAHSMKSFTHNITADGLVFYYCAPNGNLYKKIVNTNQTVQLPWLSPTLKCKQTNSIIYNNERNSLIFPITQNGLDGVAEYSLAP